MKILVIGDGPAGNAAAISAKNSSRSAQVTVVSEEPYYTPCAFPYYIQGSLPRDKLYPRSGVRAGDLGIVKIIGVKALSIDPDQKLVILSNGEELRYDRLIVATGSRPSIPSIKGLDATGFHTFKTISDADRIAGLKPCKTLIVGSGVIGIELAIALRKRGFDVSMVEIKDWIVPAAFDREVSEAIREKLEKAGINIYTGEMVQRIEQSDRGNTVVTTRREISCSQIIIAAGMKPNTKLAVEAGVRVGSRGGIIVDEYMQTNIPDIYACGDCVESFDPATGRKILNMTWPNAVMQGIVAGCNSAGGRKRHVWAPRFISVNIFGVPAISIGATASELQGEIDVVKKVSGSKKLNMIFQDGRLVGAQAFGLVKCVEPVYHGILKSCTIKETLKYADIMKPLMSPQIMKLSLNLSLIAGKSTVIHR